MGLDILKIPFRREPCEDQDSFELIKNIISWEEWLIGSQFIDNASETPEIGGSGVVFGSQKNFGCSVPSCGDSLGHDILVSFDIGYAADQSEIAELDLAIRVDEDVGWLQIAVEDRSAVQVFQRTSDLVNYE